MSTIDHKTEAEDALAAAADQSLSYDTHVHALIGIGHAILAGVELLERITKQLETISADVGDLRRTVER